MKKSELKSGMVIEDRRGKRGIVLIGSTQGDVIGGLGDIGGNKSTWGCLGSFNDDLTSTYGREYDIMKVFNPDDNLSFGKVFYFIKSYLIWKRVEAVELTMEEIADKFGVDVNNLKIKK